MENLGFARHAGILWVIATLFTATISADAADTIEFLNGAKLEGKVIAIDKEHRMVEFEVTIAGSTRARKYGYNKIHRVVWNGKEYEVTQKEGNALASSPAINSLGAGSDGNRSAAEVRAIIDSVGGSAPDWLAATPVEYPNAVDLNWPIPAPQPWNNQRNVGQYIWDRINPNSRQWQSGVRFMYFLLSHHKNNPELRQRVMESIGAMYFRFFQDYARAAYWWEKSGVRGSDQDAVGLAECYFRLGLEQAH